MLSRRTLAAAFALLALPSAWAQTVPAEKILVIAKRRVKPRSTIQTRLGATVYTLSAATIRNQPGGEDIPLNQTLLQTPGVSQDSFGQIHLRNDHANIQYRIDGVILPEGISFFGQSLTSRFASSIDVITGSLPAQYGLVTTGIVDISTKSGGFDAAGSVGVYGGSQGWLEPSVDYAGSHGDISYYVAGDLLRNEIGIENPSGGATALHDTTRQAHGFGIVEDTLDDTSKITAIAGVYQGAFQIPDREGQPSVFADGTQPAINSADLNERESESNDYAALSYLKTAGAASFQLSVFGRFSRLAYTPDPVGDLEFYGLAQTATRTDVAEGLQGDGSLPIGPDHTLRFGVLVTGERADSDTQSQVFPCLVQDCSRVGTTPITIAGSGGQTGLTYGLYLQDEWQVAPSLTLNDGLRYDVLNAYTDAQQLSPRLNLVWQADAATTLHAGYARYFTPPSLENISGQSVGAFAGTTGYPAGYTPAQPPGSGPILPERSDYIDIGAQRIVLPGLKFGIDGYWKYAHDLIDEGQFGAPIILSVFNYAHANVLGAEFTGSYDTHNLSAYGNLSVGRERARRIVSQQFNFTPQDLATIAGQDIYTDHSQFITISAGASYNLHGTHLNTDMIYGTGLRKDAGDIPNGGTVAPYYQLNLGVSRRFADVFGAPVELSLSAINVTDRVYQLRAGSGVGVFAPQYGPRRTLYAAIRTFFG